MLVSKSHTTLVRLRGEQPPETRSLLGRLLHPKDRYNARASLEAGLPLAADNRAFVGFEADAFMEMLDVLAGLPLKFVTVPDVVGDAEATDALWRRWAADVIGRGLVPAYVAQDGYQEIPENAGALFVGGTDELKLGPVGERAVADAKARGLWVHVGRVNSTSRIRYCRTLGADSFDGTQWSMFTRTYLAGGLAAASAPAQGRLW